MRKGGGGKCPPIVFLEGANIHHYAFVEGDNYPPLSIAWGQMSTHAIFHRGADVRGGGGNVRLPVDIQVRKLSTPSPKDVDCIPCELYSLQEFE